MLTATVVLDEGTVAPSTRLGLAFPASVGMLASLTSIFCTSKALKSWTGDTTTVVTLATEGWSLGASRLTVKYAGSTVMSPDVVSQSVNIVGASGTGGI